MPDMSDHHNAVSGCDSEQGDKADDRGDRQHAAREVDARHTADQRQRQVQHDQQRIARPAAEVVRIPEGLDFTDAAALMHAGVCAWIALVETAQIGPGMHVLIHGGAGAIGGMAVQIASHFGARVSATCRAANSDYALGLGAQAVIAYDQVDFAEVVSDVDVVLDLVGGDVHDRSCRALRPGGILVFLIAEPFEDRSAEYGIDLRQAVIDDDRSVLEKVVELAVDGAITSQVSRVMALSEATHAHRLVESGRNTCGRIVLRIH